METTESKKYPPSAKKLRELRKKGQFPKTELVEPTFSILVFFIVFFIFIYSLFYYIDNVIEIAILNDIKILFLLINNIFIYSVLGFAFAKLIFFLLNWVLVNKSTINNQVFSIKFDKLNPIMGLKNSFGIDAIFNSTRKIVELIFLLLVIKYAFDTYGGVLLQLYFLNNASSFVYYFILLIKFIFVIMLTFGISIGVMDYFFERFRFMKKHRMTMTEMKNEMKDTEGSPQIKMIRRSKMREIMNEPMRHNRRPDFAIANPTHILIPICFDNKIDLAPILLDVYTDSIALKKRQYLESLDIPIIEDKALARRIVKKSRRGGEYIDKEFYQDIALIIVALRRKNTIENN